MNEKEKHKLEFTKNLIISSFELLEQSLNFLIKIL